MKDLNLPEGYQTVMPYLILPNAKGFINFMKNVFHAKEREMHMRTDELIMHGELIIGGSTIMFADSTDEFSVQNAGLYITVKNADETYAKALSEGATSIMEPVDKEYGRSCGIKDPHGNVWWVTSAINK